MTLAFRAALSSVLRSFFVLALFGLTISAHKAGAKPRAQAVAEKRSWFPTHDEFLEMSRDEKKAFVLALREGFSAPISRGDSASIDALWGGRLDAFNALFFPLSEAQGSLRAQLPAFQCELGGVFSSEGPNAATGRCPGARTLDVAVTIPGTLRSGTVRQPQTVRPTCSNENHRMCNPMLYGFVISSDTARGATTQRIVEPICFPQDVGSGTRPGSPGESTDFNRECERFADGEWVPAVREGEVVRQTLEGAAREAHRRNRLAAQVEFLAANAETYQAFQTTVRDACRDENYDRITDRNQRAALAARCAAIRTRIGANTPGSAMPGDECRMVSGLMRTSAMCYACALEARERKQPGRAAFQANRGWLLSLAVGRQLCPGSSKPAMHEMIERFGYCEAAPENERLRIPDGRSGDSTSERGILESLASGELSPDRLNETQKGLVAKGLGLSIDQLRNVLCPGSGGLSLGRVFGRTPAFDRQQVKDALAALRGPATQRSPVAAAWRACAEQAFQPDGNQSRFQQNGCNAGTTMPAPGQGNSLSGQADSYPAVFEPTANTGACHVILSPTAVQRNGNAMYPIASFSRPDDGPNRAPVRDFLPDPWSGGTVRRVSCAFPTRTAPPAAQGGAPTTEGAARN